MKGIIWKSESEFVEYNAAPLFGEIATRNDRGTMHGTLLSILPNPDPVLANIGRDITILQDVLTDPHVSGAIDARKAGVLSMKYEIDRDAIRKGTESTHAANVVRDCFARLEMRRVISEILDARSYGFQPLEVVWEYAPKGPGRPGYYILPKSICGKPTDWFSFNSMNQLAFNRGLTGKMLGNEPVPERRFLVPTNDASYSNPYGVALLSRCYWSVYFKRVMIRLWVTYSEKYGTPWASIKYKYGTDEAEVRKVVQMVKNAVADAVLAVPDKYEPSLTSPGNTSSVDTFQALIGFCNDEITKAVLGHTGGMSSTPGKLGNENTAEGAKYDKKLADKELVESTLNTLIRWIYELNFSATNDGQLPTFSLFDEDDVDLDLANLTKILFDQGVRFSAEFYAQTFGFLPGHISIAPPVPATPPQFAAAPPQAGNPAAYKAPEETGLTEDVPGDTGDTSGRSGAEQVLTLAPADDQTKGVVDPLLSAVRSSSDFAEAQRKVAAMYPELDSSALARELSRAYFIIALAGQLSAAAEDPTDDPQEDAA